MQEPRKTAYAASNVADRSARIAIGAIDQESVDIDKLHRVPRFASAGQIILKLGDVLKFFMHRHVGVAAMTVKMVGIFFEQWRAGSLCRCRSAPRRRAQSHEMIDPTEGTQRAQKSVQ